MKRKSRWYDQYPKLAIYLERLNGIPGDQRDCLISGVMTIIKQNAPNLLERYVLDFPLDIQRRRWYDNDPYLWLLFNGLQYADKPLLTEVTQYLQGEMTTTTASVKVSCKNKASGKKAKKHIH